MALILYLKLLFSAIEQWPFLGVIFILEVVSLVKVIKVFRG